MKLKAAPLPLLAVALVLTGTLTGCVDRNAQKIAADTAKIVSNPEKTVRVEAPRVETLEETVDISGDVTTSQDVQASFRAPGRLGALYVSDGDRVTQGQLIASLDTSTLLPQVQQAQAQLQSATAQYQQALNNARLTPARSNAGISQAQAGLRSAQANLTKALRGARSEERAQAQARVNSARANLTLARTDLTRYQRLVKEGAIAQQRLDQARNTFDTATAALNEATQALATLTNGSRTEDIAVAREAVRQAESQLQTAKATRSLDSTLTDAANAAKAQVEAAAAALRLTQQNLTDAQLKA
ncbi:MAG: biotin/lipoyl-binding protein, partial [Sphingomonadales bacterium]